VDDVPTGNLSAAAAAVARPERITEVAKLEAAILKGHPNGARCKSHVLTPLPPVGLFSAL